MPNGIVEHEVAREVLLSGTVAMAEPTGFGYAVANFLPLPCPIGHSVSTDATGCTRLGSSVHYKDSTGGQYTNGSHLDRERENAARRTACGFRKTMR
jgi:hypothetical protein